MKFKAVSLALSTVLLAACTTQAPQTLQQSDLLHRHFVLQSVDGKTIGSDKNRMEPGIEFGEKMHVSGAMCNRFMGQGELQNNILKVEHLASTRMACIDPARAALDPIITDVLSQGAEVSLIKGQLTLKNANHTLVYQQKDWM
ncbi:heat shock protein HslJ [Hafnia paralvei]|uniref:heat shock protein HslJ n=1 Tax=Hafnia paralvei TaxID=546367 RepID=UPI00141A2EA8|nr:heat shock protein HslJ [Hafnia paralvei]NIH31052.1 heat shock protein HslJ [Hafnia paralvei]